MKKVFVYATAAFLLAAALSAVAFATDGVPRSEDTDAPPTSFWGLFLTQPVISVFAIIGLGVLAGQVRVFGVSLGSSGVIFVAIVFGALGCHTPRELGNFGLVLFVYCIGLSAGPSFFRAFFRQGADLAKLSIVLLIVGTASIIVFAKLSGVSGSLASGIFAGALTSTPGLAAAMSVADDPAIVSVGYGLAYPFGVIGVVLFVQLLPRLLGYDLEVEGRNQAAADPNRKRIERVLIEVRNPSVLGRRVQEVHFIDGSHCQVSRILRGDRLAPISPETVFEEGCHILAVGEEDRLQDIIDFLGKRSDRNYSLDLASQLMQVVVTSTEVVGKSLRDLNLINQFAVTVTRIVRNDVGFVPNKDTIVQRGDVLYAVGEPPSLKKFAAFAGHRARVLDETDLISLSVGIIAGVLLGMTPIALPGTRGFTLGLAGGPLLVALLLGHVGGVGRIRGHMPRAARLLMTEIGLVFFLASAGVKAGESFVEVVRQQGPLLLAMGAVATSLPLVAGYLFARYILRMSLLDTLGGICGGMTSTPGLGAIAGKTDSEVPAVSYATAYPVALILKTVLVQIIIAMLA